MYKKSFSRVFCLVLVLAFLFVLTAGCGAKDGTDPAAEDNNTAGAADAKSTAQQAPAQEPVKLVYWLFGSPTAEADKDLPEEKWYITGAIKRFEEANPNITVELLVLPQEGLGEKFKAAGLAKNGPDVCNLWTGSMLTDNKNFILPFDQYLTADEVAMINGIEAAKEGFKPEGTMMGMPTDNSILTMYYNKKLMDKAGVDLNALPTDMDGFFQLCEKIKSSGVTPFIIGDKEGYQSVFFLMTLYATAAGEEGIRNLVEGKVSFSEDKDWLDCVKAYQELYKRGYTNKDVASLDDTSSQTKFYSGAGAMVVGGSWIITSGLEILGNDLGMFKIPSLRADTKNFGALMGGPSQALVVTSYSEHPEEAARFVKFLVGRKELEIAIKDRDHGSGTTPYKYVSPDVFADPFSKRLQEYSMNSVIVPWMDNQLPSEVSSEFYKLSAVTLSGKLSAETLSQKLDEQIKKVLSGK